MFLKKCYRTSDSNEISLVVRLLVIVFGVWFLVYDYPESELKLNDIFEFVGILTYDLDLRDDNEDCDLSNGHF